MENAARGVGDKLRETVAVDDRIVIVCGPGNNGGDGLTLARQLAAVDRACEVYLVRGGKRLADDAQTNLDLLAAAEFKVQEVLAVADLAPLLSSLASNDMIVDGLLGTGVRGLAREPFAGIIDLINQSAAKVLAVDVPSGLDCDTGEVAGACVQADQTVTFVATKRGFANPTTQHVLGDVTVAHIGIPLQWVQAWLEKHRS